MDMVSHPVPGSAFPDPELALRDPDGLLASGGELCAEMLADAYQHGIFPWYNDDADPVLWWSPDPRTLLFPGALRVSRSLRRRLRRQDFELRIDSAFNAVIGACAERRPIPGPPPEQQATDAGQLIAPPGAVDQAAASAGTWITPRMMAAYQELHELGFAHSFESWQDDTLVGGLYGVSWGGAFFGESMFSHRSDASKVAFAHLAEHCFTRGFHFIDCQMPSAHLASLGAVDVPRTEFLHRLRTALREPTQTGPWAGQLDHV